MSLHNAAKHIAAHGRGKDTVLIHMTPEEVGGLQAVAKAHGGSLTINPHTGLAEAGFLQAILPTLLGAGLSMIPGVGPLMAAGIVGGGTALASGDLKKGLMAGLGAYGGAGIYGAMNPAAVATQGASTAAASTAAAAPTSIVPNAPALTPIPAAAPIAPVSGTLGSGTYGLGGIPDAAQSVMVNPSSAAFSPTAVTQGTPPTYLGPNMSSANLPSTKIDLGLKPSYTPPAKSFEDALLSRNGAMVAGSVFGGMQEDPQAATPANPGMIRPYTFDRTKNASAFQDVAGEPLSSKQRRYFTDQYTALPAYKAPGPEYMAAGGPVEQMSNQAAMGANTMYPMANMASSSFATPYQAPLSTNMLAPSGDAAVGINAEPNMQGTRLAAGGALGSYSDGGRMLKGPGDGMSDNIPAVIGKKQPARLADGEFVVPADVVSHLGNGSTDAGAKQLYAMMDKIRAARTGTKKQGKQINPRKYMPA
jgi:hypothetical protein